MGASDAVGRIDDAHRAHNEPDDELQTVWWRFFLWQSTVHGLFTGVLMLATYLILYAVGLLPERIFSALPVTLPLMVVLLTLVSHFMVWRRERIRSNLLLVGQEIVRYDDEDRVVRIPLRVVQVRPLENRIGRWWGFVRVSTPEERQSFSLNRRWYAPGELERKLRSWTSSSVRST